MKNQTDFSSRIGVRAVTAGVMTSISFMLMSLSLIAALGIWDYNLNEITTNSAAFWISTTIAWVMSLYFAGLVASLGARSQSKIEGALNAIAACCGTYLLFCMGFLLFAPSALDAILSTANPQFYLRTFLGDVIAFAFGIYGGVVGVNFEHNSEENYKGGRNMATHY